MTTEDALREYLVERGFVETGTPREELYRSNWVKVPMWGYFVSLLDRSDGIHEPRTSLLPHADPSGLQAWSRTPELL